MPTLALALATLAFAPPPSIKPHVPQPRTNIVTFTADEPPVAAPLQLGLVFAPTIGGAAGALMAEMLPRRMGVPMASAMLPVVMITAFPQVFCKLGSAFLTSCGSVLLRCTARLDAVQKSMRSELLATQAAFGLVPAPATQLAVAEPPQSLPRFATALVPRNPGTKKRYAPVGKYIHMSAGEIFLENMKQQNGLATNARLADKTTPTEGAE